MQLVGHIVQKKIVNKFFLCKIILQQNEGIYFLAF